MGIVEVIGIAVVVVLALIFAGIASAFGLPSAAALGGIVLALEGLIVVLVLGVVIALLVFKAAPLARTKARDALALAASLVGRSERFAASAGYKVIAPMVWLYSRVAWLRGFAEALRRGEAAKPRP